MLLLNQLGELLWLLLLLLFYSYFVILVIQRLSFDGDVGSDNFDLWRRCKLHCFLIFRRRIVRI